MSRDAGRSLGLGPVFAYEWLTASRRWQGYAVRSIFVLLLLIALVVVWTSRREVVSPTTIRGLAAIGERFFIAVVGTQLTLVLLAAPAATAGAICLDRARGTMTHLLVTDLSDREIVLGKLAARLVPVLGLVGCTLPVLAILTLLGGVDPAALVGAFMVTLGIAVFGCGLALLLSLSAGKTHEALLGTYAVWGVWLLGAPMINQINRVTGWNWVVPPRTANPFALAFAPYWWPGAVGWRDFLGFLSITCVLSTLLTLVAVWRLRSVCTRETVRKAEFRSRYFALCRARLQMVLRFKRDLPGPTLDFNPVLWREWHRSRPTRWARIVGGLFVVLATVFSVVAVIGGGGNGVAAWVNGLQVSIGLLLLSVTAASSLAEERVRGSLDVLMATPLSTPQIILGKWLGTFRRVLPMTILPGLIILCSPRRGIEPWQVFLLAITFILCSGAATTSVGLAMATWCARVGRAVGLTVTLYILVTVGWIFLAMMLSTGPRSGEGPMMGSSFFWVGEMTFVLYARPAIETDHFAWAAFWTLAYALAAIAFLAATLATFNHCLGRVETGLPRLLHGSMEKPKPDIVPEVVGESIGVG